MRSKQQCTMRALVLVPAARYLQRHSAAAAPSISNQRLWGCHLGCTSTHSHIPGQFGGICFAPQVPPAPRRTTAVVSTKPTSSRLSLAPCCAGQPSFGHIQAAPRRALFPLDSIRRRSSQAKTTDLTTVRSAGLLITHKASKALRGPRGTMHLVAPRRGAQSCSPRQTKSRAAT
jgi:hypothetical protein